MPAWVTLVISLVSGLLPLAQQVGKLWESSAGFSAIFDLISKSSIFTELEKVGSELFPAVEQKIATVLAAIHLGYAPATKWVQTSLNAIELTGYISFGSPLVVDGIPGPKTFAAIVTLQNKVGLKPTGAVAQLEYQAINNLLAGHVAGVPSA